ncbi:MAG: molybdopterin molybdotransferase MoeA [Anaerolineales bacterium]|nr:molybdopterin molybdotransferase MoeA [Anaerolineales bacterium]
MKELLSVADASARLLKDFSPVGSETLSITEAVGRVITHDVISIIDLPAFNNSSMDGFAVRSADIRAASIENPIELSIIADIPAGKVIESTIKPGEAARIMTGAALPPGADTVVPVEDTDQFDELTRMILPYRGRAKIFRSLQPGDYVRKKGEDINRGDTVLPSGSKLRPQDIGYMAMLGISEVSVYLKPRVAIFSTGDELLQAGESLRPGKVYDSNAYTLSALVEREGGSPIYLGIAADEEQSIRDMFDMAVSQRADLILSTAGVSVGAFDYVRKIVEEYGTLFFWRVNMRPGKPILFGYMHDIPFFGLPGNPVSAFVGFEVFVRPALQKMIGIKEIQRPFVHANLMEEVKSDGRESYLRAIVSPQEDRWVARLTGHQGSGNLLSLVQANALLIIPSGVKSLPIGSEVKAWLLEDVC